MASQAVLSAVEEEVEHNLAANRAKVLSLVADKFFRSRSYLQWLTFYSGDFHVVFPAFSLVAGAAAHDPLACSYPVVLPIYERPFFLP